MKVSNKLAALSAAIILCGCNPTKESTYTYKIEEQDAPETSNRNVYESLGDHTFTKNQKYRITLNEGNKSFHYLIVNIKLKIGNKTIRNDKGTLLPINDGFYDYECTHYYDVKLTKSIDDVDNPVCEITPVGVVVPDAKASRVNVTAN